MICPVGAVSEAVWKLGKRLFGKNFTMPLYADYCLRSVKYILMAFFIYVVVLKMPSFAILRFIEGTITRSLMWRCSSSLQRWPGPQPSLCYCSSSFPSSIRTSGAGISVPMARCLGLSAFQPYEDNEKWAACIHCMRCTKNCPSQLPVEQLDRVSHRSAQGALHV